VFQKTISAVQPRSDDITMNSVVFLDCDLALSFLRILRDHSFSLLLSFILLICVYAMLKITLNIMDRVFKLFVIIPFQLTISI
jgi:hypothetical protein